MVGVILGLVYAWGLEKRDRLGWWPGIVLSIPHMVIAGFFMLVMPAVHPAVPEHPAFQARGFMAFGASLGSGIGFIMVHILFGSTVGALYKPTNRAASKNP